MLHIECLNNIYVHVFCNFNDSNDLNASSISGIKSLMLATMVLYAVSSLCAPTDVKGCDVW